MDLLAHLDDFSSTRLDFFELYWHVTMRKNILLLCISTLLTLCGCELLIRVLIPQASYHDVMYRAEKKLGWEFVPDKKVKVVYEGGINHFINFNQDGFRDTPFTKKTEAYKIMVLGDSFVSNIAVEDEEVFTQVMEEQIGSTSVYNFGVNGYGQIQEYLLLKEWLPRVKADLIVQFIYLRNDFTDNVAKFPWLFPRPTATFDANDKMQIEAPNFENHKAKEKPPIYYKSQLFLFIKRRLSQLKAKTANKTNALFIPPEIYTCRKPQSDDTVELYEIMQKLLLEINQYAKTNNTPVIFVLAPSLFQVEDSLWSELQVYDPTVVLQRDLPNQKLIAFAMENNLEMLDLMPLLREANRNESQLYHDKEQHWTVEGNRVVAHALAKYIKTRIKPNSPLF